MGHNHTIKNCIFSKNRVNYDSGGIYIFDGGIATIINSTFTGNLTVVTGVGVIDSTPESSAIIINSILWDNFIWDSNSRSYIVSEISGPATVTYSNIQGGFTGTGNIDANPLFVTPGYWDDNGTPEDLEDDVWVDGDYHLQDASPCIDSGTAVSAPDEDIEGTPRPQGDGFDMGAYEFLVSPEPMITVTPADLDFGDVTVGDSSNPFEISISNDGTADLIVSGMTLYDTENCTLDVTGGSAPCGTLTPTISPNGNCTVAVTFHPQIATAMSGDLLINCNDPHSPSVDVSITGTGIEAEPPPAPITPTGGGGGGCSIVRVKMSIENTFAVVLLIIALLWLGIRRRRGK